MKGIIKGIILILIFYNYSFSAFATDDMDRVSTTGESQEQTVKTASRNKKE